MQADYHDQAIAMERLASAYLTAQLRRLVLCVEGLGMSAPDGEIPDYVKYAAFVFTTTFDAWKQFCIDCGIKPDAPIQDIEGSAYLKESDLDAASASNG